jgi:NADPH:quinone reductase-like Zn-dependent oxidoreductase/aryl carrier-like protein
MIIARSGDLSTLSFVDDESAKAALESDEVQIKAFAYALGHPDIDGPFGTSNASPCTVECAGVITAVGSSLEHVFQVGDRVCAWHASVPLASLTRAKGSVVQKIPKSWSFPMGAAFPHNASVAYYGLIDCAQVEPGQTVLVNGVSGSLGQTVALVARHLGLQVLATVKNEAEKMAVLSLKGPKFAQIFYSDDFTLSKSLLAFTRGVGVDVLFNTSSAPLPEDLLKAVVPFGTVIEISGRRSWFSATPDNSTKYVSFDATKLLRYRPSLAGNALKALINQFPDEHAHSLFSVVTTPITDNGTTIQAVMNQANTDKIVLLAGIDAVVSVNNNISTSNGPAGIEPLVRFVAGLNIPQDQKDTILTMASQLFATRAVTTPSQAIGTTHPFQASGATLPLHKSEATLAQRLANVSNLSQACQIIVEEQIEKLASLLDLTVDEINPRKSLIDLGLDQATVVELKDWLRSAFGADISTPDITGATDLESLAALVTQRSRFIPRESGDISKGVNGRAKASETKANGNTASDRAVNGSASPNQAGKRESLFVPNQLPKLPLPDINALCSAFLTGAKVFATPEEYNNTVRAIEDFKRPGSAGRRLYDRAAARAADPAIENWAWEPTLRRNFLDRRVSLTPCSSFWFGHPFSKRQHSQAERASLLAYAANMFRLDLEAGRVKPVMLNERELTTACYPWMFNSVRIPGSETDEMRRYPNNDYFVVFWRGHAFKLDLFVENRPVTYQELFNAIKSVLSQPPPQRSFVTIFTSDNRSRWAETRQKLQQLSPQNAASIEAIEAAAFTISLDEAAPETSAERGRQFHCGGDTDAANRWNDKSIQFIVCSNGYSGTVGDHTMLDAMTLSELNDAIAVAIDSDIQLDSPGTLPTANTITTVHLPLETDATLDASIDKARAQYFNFVKDAEHIYFLFKGYGSRALRAKKMSPNSVFQMVVQLAARWLYGESPPCWETVNQAHYHLGRVDIIQIVNPQVAAFLDAASDSSISMSERRNLLINATRAHVACINKSRRNLGWERNFSAIRALMEENDPLPALFDDPVYKRVRPRVMISNCFETGMTEKGCMWRDIDSVWMHYEVHDDE